MSAANRAHMESENTHWGTQVPFESINEAGTYVCNWSGHVLRVPDDSIQSGRTPVLTIVGNEPLFVTKVSDDPFVSISKARMLAADCDLPVNF